MVDELQKMSLGELENALDELCQSLGINRKETYFDKERPLWCIPKDRIIKCYDLLTKRQLHVYTHIPFTLDDIDFSSVLPLFNTDDRETLSLAVAMTHQLVKGKIHGVYIVGSGMLLEKLFNSKYFPGDILSIVMLCQHKLKCYKKNVKFSNYDSSNK